MAFCKKPRSNFGGTKESTFLYMLAIQPFNSIQPFWKPRILTIGRFSLLSGFLRVVAHRAVNVEYLEQLRSLLVPIIEESRSLNEAIARITGERFSGQEVLFVEQ